MSDFTSVFPENKLLDPNKRVNYIHGLVLGVDEFKQEECYLLEKDKLHNRVLHGYGTACGLSVSQQDEPTGLEIKVEPGIAISPSGQVIQVPRTQCATLDEWLASNSEDVAEAMGSPASGSLSLYLMLCYRECKTDLVPIPTGPCQSLEETSAPSRIADDFSLSFELQAPPEEHFESPMQEFSELLMSIPVAVGGSLTLEDIKLLVRSLIPQGSPGSPPVAPGSPPVIDSIAPENIEQFFNAAFLVWVTEVKPCLINRNDEQVPSMPYQHCVFLAQLNFDVQIIDGIARVDDSTALEIDEQSRQFLLNSQGIQNYLGPLSYLIKSQSGAPVPTDADAMNLNDNQIVTGSKTFHAPIILGRDGRVRKNIVLPAQEALRRLSVAQVPFNNVLPSVRFPTTGANAFRGQAIFNLPIPDDMLHANRFQYRLMWGFQGTPAGGELNFNWTIGMQAYVAGQAVDPRALETTSLAVSAPASSRNSVMVTDFAGIPRGMRLTRNTRQAVIQIGIERTAAGAMPPVSLIQIEMQYVANNLGRRM